MNYFEQVNQTEAAIQAAELEARRGYANVSRRSLLKQLGIGMGGLVIGIQMPAAAALPMKWADEAAPAGDFVPNVYLKIHKDNRVTVIVHRSEMGQGIRTSIPMLIAEELEVDWQNIEIEQALADAKYGSQNTDGSRSIRRFYSRLREAAASARTMLEQAAAAEWKVPLDQCRAENSFIVHASGKRLSFGELVDRASQLPVPAVEALKLKSSKNFRYVNQKQNVPLIDGKDIATGKTTFGFDVQRPGMKYVVIARPPVLASGVKSFDATAAKKVKGVVDVIAMDDMTEPAAYKPLGGVAVIADSTWAAIKARKELSIDWQWSEHRSHNTEAHIKDLQQSCDTPEKIFRKRGDAQQMVKQAKRTHSAEYYVPALIHAPMEPPAATAEFKEGKFKIWACTQAPQAAQNTVSQLTGVKPENIQVYVTLLGGGFGRKSKADFVAEAAVLAKKVGYPVKVVWTREDEIQQGYYHAESYQKLTAALDESKRSVEAWQQVVAEPPIGSTFQKGANLIGSESNLGLTDLPYDIPNIFCAAGKAEAHHRIGWLRSVTNINHAFASCSFADELAHELKQDPKDFLLKLIGDDRKIDFTNENAEYGNYGEELSKFPVDTGRLKAVIRRVAELSEWDKPRKNNRFLGIAAHRSFVSYVATVVEVSLTKNNKIKLENIWMVSDSGTVVNLDRVKSQMEGAAIFGISIARYGEITSKQGEIQQSNFHDYPVARFSDVPPIHVDVMINDAPPGGVGEPGVPPVAPAICNAIFAATGKRIRKLPLKTHGIMA